RSPRRIQKTDPTLAEALKPLGYAAAQFGKNHLGDRNEFLPTVHGFDEWFGNRRQRCTSNFNIGFMGALEPRYNHVLFPTDFMWIKLTDDRALPSDVAASRFLRISVGTRRHCSPNAKSIYKPVWKRLVKDQEQIVYPSRRTARTADEADEKDTTPKDG